MKYDKNFAGAMHGRRVFNLESKIYEMMSFHGSAEHSYYLL